MEVVDEFQRKNVLDIRPSVTVAKNIKRKKDLVLALLNQEIIEPLFTKIFEHVWYGTQKTIPFGHWVSIEHVMIKKSYLINAIVGTIHVLQLHQLKKMISEWVSVKKE